METANLKKKLKESEKKHRGILENMMEGYFEVDLKGTLTFVNDRYCKIFGYSSKEELIGKNHRTFQDEKTAKKLFKIYNQLYKNEIPSPVLIERQNVTPSGETIYYETLADVKYDSEGNKVGFFGLIRDITERTKAEKKLKDSEKKYREILENIKEGYFEVDLKGNHTFMNDYFCKILGSSREEMMGKNYKVLYEEKTHKETFKIYNQLYKNEISSPYVYERDLVLIDEELHHLEVLIDLQYDSEGEKVGFFGLIRDITKRKQAEQKLKESEEKYRKAYDRANFYKDLFAHDINNILQIIASSAEYISFHLNDYEKAKSLDDFWKIIQAQADRGGKLVKNVLTLSKLEEEQVIIHPIKIYDALKNSIDFIKKTYEDRSLTIQVDSIDEELIVQANVLLQDVFENIMINSVRYTENKNIEILIKTSNNLIDNKNYVRIEFIDNGIGVPDNRKENIFKEGERELKGTKGIGLGLSLVNKILTTFNGKIWVEDKIKGDYGKGSNFIVLLPITV